MRLDKMLSEVGILSRKETARAARAGEIAVNGVTEKRPDRKIDPETDVITLHGEPVAYSEFLYIMLNKPAGYISATEDGNLPVVTELLPERLQKVGLFPCGRLDRDTVGLMILTNDGILAHRLLSPKHHAEKVYAFRAKKPLRDEDVAAMSHGMVMDGDELKDARLSLSPDRLSGEITLTEGKYHQIKRMFLRCENEITYLARLSFGGVKLDPALAPGEFRFLTDEEIETLRRNR